ncbi:MAG: Smr/MutS family protein, partial [Deltaproteobacteria bacterium]|nr:Smr/MutS family protein [Deltaproteobacteria bacterium]
RDDRYVLPVVASQKRTLSGIIHGMSQTGATVYVEPQELVDGNNQLALAHEAVRREERRILAELSQMCAEHRDELLATSEVLTLLDLRMAAGRLAVQLGAHRPRFGDGTALDAPTVSIPALRHPILVLDGVQVVANAVRWSAPAHWLVVSGPNGGGKTVVLSAVGLAVEMARMGLFVCASADTVLPWFDRVETVLGDAQDIERGLSTFEGHLRRIAEVLAAAEQPGHTLVLLDELATGTEPLAGAALATAILEHAMANLPRAWGVVTTHFEALKLLALRNPACVNAALELDARSLTPTFRLTLGHMGTSNPLALAARLGMPASIVHRAEQLMGTGGSEVMQLLDRLQAERQALADAEQAVQREKKQLENSRQLLDDQRNNEQRAIDRRIERATADMSKQLQAIAQELTQARQAAASADKQRIEEAAKVVSQRQVEVERLGRAATARLGGQIEREPVRAAQLQVGSVAWHLGLNSRVELIEASPKADRFKVRAGGLELWCTLAELATSKPTDAPPATKHQGKQGAQSSQPADSTAQPRNLDEGAALLRQPDATVDVRGMRAEEAVREVDRHLDKMILTGRPGACVVHGHGTGALRDAVRAHLRRHPHVAHSRPGNQGEGGDGATLVWLET